MTAHDRDVYLADVVEAGTAGFLTKEEAGEALVEAIRRAVRGEILFTREQLARARQWREEVGQRWEGLTRREREVLTLVAQFQTDAEIARALCISEKTVGHHVSNILSKLNMTSRREAGRWVVEHKLLEL